MGFARALGADDVCLSVLGGTLDEQSLHTVL